MEEITKRKRVVCLSLPLSSAALSSLGTPMGGQKLALKGRREEKVSFSSRTSRRLNAKLSPCYGATDREQYPWAHKGEGNREI